jgi:hypothetical protein
VHRITSVIEKALVLAQAFDKVWHEGLIHKLETFLPEQYAQILKSYRTERYFGLKQEEAYSDLKEIKAGVPQGSALGPVRYLLHTSDLPAPENNTVATFADDAAIFAVGHRNEEATEKLQEVVSQTGQKDGVSN